VVADVDTARDLPLWIDDALDPEDFVDVADDDFDLKFVHDVAGEAMDRVGDVGSESGDIGESGWEAADIVGFGDRVMLSAALTLRMGEIFGSLWAILCR
jgi:hypothetical protein